MEFFTTAVNGLKIVVNNRQQVIKRHNMYFHDRESAKAPYLFLIVCRLSAINEKIAKSLLDAAE